MNPIPNIFPPPASVRDYTPAPSVDQADRVRQFEQMLDDAPPTSREVTPKETTSAEPSKDDFPVQDNNSAQEIEMTDEGVTTVEVASGRIGASHGKAKAAGELDSTSDSQAYLLEKADSSVEISTAGEGFSGREIETTYEGVTTAEVASGRVGASHGKVKAAGEIEPTAESNTSTENDSDSETTASVGIATGGFASVGKLSVKETVSGKAVASFHESSVRGASVTGVQGSLSEIQGSPTEEIAQNFVEGDSVAFEEINPSTASMDSTEMLHGGAVNGLKKKGHEGDDTSGDSSQYGSGIVIPVKQSVVVPPGDVSALSGAEAVGRIEQIAALIAQTAQQVTFDGNDSVRISLSPEQLPDSKLVIQMTHQVVQVTFLSDNASSLSLLQARGGEVAASLALRFDREIRIEVKTGGYGSDSSDSDTTLASWAIRGNAESGSTSSNA